MRIAVIGVVLLPLEAEAANCTGDDTVAPFAGELIVTPAALVVPGTVMLTLFVYAFPVESHATKVTLCEPAATATDVLILAAFTVSTLVPST